MGFLIGGLAQGVIDSLLKVFGKKVTKLAFFSIYLLVLVGVLNGVKNFAMSYIDTSAFITPTICYFYTNLHAFSLLATYFAFASANWLKAKTVKFWTSGN